MSITRIRPLVGRRLPAVAWVSVLSYLVLPLALGWFAFAFADSVANFAPQTIRLSGEHDYDPYLDDFVVFYAAGHVAAGDSAADLYDPATLHAAQATELGVPQRSIIRLPFYNPPSAVFPLMALSLFTLVGAAVAWTIVQIAFFATAFGSLVRGEGKRKDATLTGLLLLAIASSMPFHETILHGQMTMILLAGWVALWFGAFERRNDKLTVLGLTLLAVKPQLVIVPFVYLVLTRRWRSVGAAAAIQAVIGLAAMVFIDPMIHLRWLQLMISATGWEDQNGIWVHAMFGWNALVRATVGPDYHLLRTAITMGLTLVTAGFCVWAGRIASRERRYAELFAMLVFASVLVSPHLFAQDLMLPVAPLVLLALTTSGRARRLWLAFGAAGWLLAFFHFDLLLGTPDERAINFVSLWLATGVALAGVGAARLAGVDSLSAPHPTHRTKSSSRLLPQFAIGALIAFLLLISLPGFARHTLAETLQYSYTAGKGVTYRVPLLGVASDGGP
ncbi:MAG: glycosyltransferase family 87 protein [Anaerolineaceae bacterium]